MNYFNDKLHKRKIDKINYNELNKLKKHCSIKKLKHYISMVKNREKKSRKNSKHYKSKM